ncbi:hypothetical protein PO398_25825, partial [Escherichia coli]
LRQKQKKLIMLPSEIMIWQPEFTDKTLSRKPGAVQSLNMTIFRQKIVQRLSNGCPTQTPVMARLSAEIVQRLSNGCP